MLAKVGDNVNYSSGFCFLALSLVTFNTIALNLSALPQINLLENTVSPNS